MQKGSGNSVRGDASDVSVGIAVARFNEEITEALLAAAREELRAWGVADGNVHMVHVAGSFELPFACEHLINEQGVEAVVALGCIIKGETQHDEYIARAVFDALQRLMSTTQIPIGLGILTVNSQEQAKARIEYGSAAAAAALGMALL